MDKLFCRCPCLSTSKKYQKEEIRIRLFGKKGDNRYLERSVQKFLNLNRRMFKFLGIEVDLSGVGNDLSLSFRTSNFIGAIPIKMPYDGIVHKDFQVTPRFQKDENSYSELTQLLSCLEHSIEPEYSEADPLTLPMQLKPPIYYEAVKYMELFKKAYRSLWVKFETRDRSHPYPKGSTNWTKYTLASYDPKNALIFPAHDSLITTHHREWQELKYVFDLAKDLVMRPSVPGSIRFKYENQFLTIASRVSNVLPVPTNEMVIRASDPPCIKETKKQANIILKKNSNHCAAWRMDMARLFERYVQYIVEKGTHELSGRVIPNPKMTGRANFPSWGLKYLEPDLLVNVGNTLYAADAKYKANFYATNTSSDILKETHRADLHQLLAYCSFEPQREKTGLLFYPAKETSYRKITYTNRFGGVENKVFLCGLAFGVDEMKKAIEKIKELFQKSVLAI